MFGRCKHPLGVVTRRTYHPPAQKFKMGEMDVRGSAVDAVMRMMQDALYGYTVTAYQCPSCGCEWTTTARGDSRPEEDS